MSAAQAAALDREILDIIAAWHDRGNELSDTEFGALALRIFAYQLECNRPYAQYCRAKGVTLERMPQSWREIPPVPAAAFKEAALTTFEPKRAALAFETSGTTQGHGGSHYMETARLYDAALLAGFDRFMLGDGAQLRYLNLVPNPRERQTSSLGYMMARVASERGIGRTGWYVKGDTLLVDDFFGDLHEATVRAQPVCVATTAFSLLAVLDAASERGLTFRLTGGSRIMETGGFKGRARSIPRDRLYKRALGCFGIDGARIVSEYGMTELTSQYYDGRAPAWLRGRAVAPDGSTLPDGVVGALVHVDLANRSSCVAVQTEDLGARDGDRIELLGRAADAEPRGCSLDAETLRGR